MKTIILGMVAFFILINSQAQIKNVKSEVKTTVTTVKILTDKKINKNTEIKSSKN
jgi:hypothetical protein